MSKILITLKNFRLRLLLVFSLSQTRHIQHNPQISHHGKDFRETPIALCIYQFLFWKSWQNSTHTKRNQHRINIPKITSNFSGIFQTEAMLQLHNASNFPGHKFIFSKATLTYQAKKEQINAVGKSCSTCFSDSVMSFFLVLLI